MQTKKQSSLEALTNTLVGFVISYASTFIIFPLMGFESSAGKNIVVTLFFTVISYLRSYIIRRVFNKKNSVVNDKLTADKPRQPIETYEKCIKRKCEQPVYELGYCFHCYMEGEMRTGG